jgi:hypothetical protein
VAVFLLAVIAANGGSCVIKRHMLLCRGGYIIHHVVALKGGRQGMCGVLLELHCSGLKGLEQGHVLKCGSNGCGWDGVRWPIRLETRHGGRAKKGPWSRRSGSCGWSGRGWEIGRSVLGLWLLHNQGLVMCIPWRVGLQICNTR